MKHYILFEKNGLWHVWRGSTEEAQAKIAYRKIHTKGYSVAHTTNTKLAKAVHEKHPSSKAFAAFAKKNKIKIRPAPEKKPEPQIVRLGKSGMARGKTVMDLRTAVDLLIGNSEMTEWLKAKVRERLLTEGFQTKTAEYRLVQANDDLTKADKLSYYQNTRQGSFVERSKR